MDRNVLPAPPKHVPGPVKDTVTANPSHAVSQPQVRAYTGGIGDTFASLAARIYGTPAAWATLWNANKQYSPNADLQGITISVPL